MLILATLTHSEDNCPGFNQEIMPNVIKGLEAREQIARKHGVKLHGLWDGALAVSRPPAAPPPAAAAGEGPRPAQRPRCPPARTPALPSRPPRSRSGRSRFRRGRSP